MKELVKIIILLFLIIRLTNLIIIQLASGLQQIQHQNKFQLLN